MRYLFFLFSFLLLGCEGFKLTGTMCDSLEPGQVLRECQPYNDEAAKNASLPPEDKSGECLECNRPEKIEIRR